MPSTGSEEQYPFGAPFQKLVLAHMLGDPTFVGSYRDAMDWNYFDRDIDRMLAETILRHYDTHSVVPSAIVIKEEIDGSTWIKDARKTEMVYALMGVLGTALTDGEYVRDKVIEFGRAMAIKMAIVRSVDLLQERKYEEIVSGVESAGAIGSAQGDDGAFVVRDFEEFAAAPDVFSARCVPTLMPSLDDLIRGGAYGGSLNMVAAPQKRGKSTFLLNIGMAAATLGYKVAHFTGELHETFLQEKYAARMTGIASQDVMKHTDRVRTQIQVLQRKNTDILVKYFPAGWTARDFDHFITRISNVHGFLPDIIIIDYDKQIGTLKKYDNDSYGRGEEVYTSLKNLAMRRDVPVWTASQTNRESVRGDVVREDKIADSFAKGMLCDLMLTISKPSEDTPPGAPILGSIWVALNRIGAQDVSIPIIADLAKATIRETCPTDTGGTPNVPPPQTPGEAPPPGTMGPSPQQPQPPRLPPGLPSLPGWPPEDTRPLPSEGEHPG